MRSLLVAIALVGSAGCLRKTMYRCSDSSQCGADGQCEVSGFCSFPDPNCTFTGRRYGEYSSEQYANKCTTEAIADIDAGVDDNMVTVDSSMDSMIDGSSTCPSNYSTTIGTHKYRVIGTNAAWDTHKTDCANDGTVTYLAIPDDQTELDGIINASGQNLTWVGINDPANNNVFLTVKNAAFSSTSPLWDSGEPDDKGTMGVNSMANCVQADTANNRLDDEECTKTRHAVCECEP